MSSISVWQLGDSTGLLMVNTGTIGTFEDGAHHCTSAYDRPNVTLRFSPAADGVFLPSIRALDLKFLLTVLQSSCSKM